MEGEEGRPPSQTPPNFVPSASQPSFPPSHAGFGFQAGPAPPPMASPPFAPHYHPTHLGHAYPAAQSSVGLLSAGLAVSSQSMSGPPLAPLPASAPPLAPAPPPSYHPLPPQPGMPPQQQGLGYLAMPGHVGGAGGYVGGYGGPGYGYLGGPVLAPRTALSCTNCRKSKVKCERVFPCARCLRLNMHCVEQCSRRGNGGSAPPPPAPHYYPPLPPGYDPPPAPVPSLHESRDARNGVPSQPAPLSGVCAGGAVLGYGPCSWFVRGYASLSATHSLHHPKATLARRSLAWQGLPPAFLTLLGATEGPPTANGTSTDQATEKANGKTEAQGEGSSVALQHVPAYLRELTALSGVSWLVFVHHHSTSAVYPSEGLTLPPLDKERHNALDTLAQLVHKGDHERFLECLAGLYFASPDNPAHTSIIVRGGPSSLPCLASVRLSVLGEGAYSALALCLQPLPPLPPFLLLAPTRPVLPFDGPAREEARGRKRSLLPPSDQDDSEEDTEEEEDSKPSPCPPRALASASPPLALPPVLGGGGSAPVSLLKAYLASCATVTGAYSEDYSRTHMVQGRPPKEQQHKPSTPQADTDTHSPGPGLYECLCVEGGMAALEGLLYGEPQASPTHDDTAPTLPAAAIDPLSLMPQLDTPPDPPQQRTSL